MASTTTLWRSSAVALAAALALACGDGANGSRTPSDLGMEQSPTEVVLYVTFSGESDKPGVTQPIDNVYGIMSDGTFDDTKNLLDPSGVTLDELRGMALSPDGSALFVANANKHLNQVLVFGPLANEPGGMKYISTYADPNTPNSAGLLHPYQPVFDANENLYVTSQDTFVVTSLASSGGETPTGTVRPTAHHWTTHYGDSKLYPGTWAPADEASQAATPPPTPDLIKSSDGGLKGPRGLVASSAFNRLYVADNADLSVKSYKLDTGKYEGKVADFNTGRPVGLELDEAQGWLFVTAETSNDVHRVDVGSASNPCDSDCSQQKIIGSQEGDAVLDAPSGIAIAPGPNMGEITLYVASRKGKQINRYVYEGSSGLQSSEVFASGFTDTPEQLIAAR